VHHVVVPKTRRAAGGAGRRWLAPFAVLTLLGAIGAIAQLPLLVPLIEIRASEPGAPDLPFAALVGLSLVNPLVLVAVAVAVGLVAAPRVGLVSHLVAWARHGTPVMLRLRRELPLSLGLGTAVGAALAFGALHLPFASTLMPLTPGVVALVLLLNGLGGVVYGWLFWRRSLESAMLAHATSHVVMTSLALVPLAPWRA
jgi:hypothetical protein